VLSYQLYQDHKRPEGMRIDLGPNGLSIEKKYRAGQIAAAPARRCRPATPRQATHRRRSR